MARPPRAIHLSFGPENGSSSAVPSQQIKAPTADLDGYKRYLHVSASGLLFALGVAGSALAWYESGQGQRSMLWTVCTPARKGP
jgi:hypothetical protein